MKLTTEQQKQIEFAKTYKEKTGSFPKSMQWNMRDVAFELDNGEKVYFPYPRKQITAAFGNYNHFRTACGEPIIKWDSNDPVTLEVLRASCKEEMRSKNPEITTPCWIWQGTTRNGYTQKNIVVDGHTRKWAVHLYILEILLKKSKPSGKHTADHICRVSNCINPDHLRWATGTQQAHNKTRSGTRANFKSRPPHHKTLTERMQWYMQQGIKDAETGCMILPLSLKQRNCQQIFWKKKGYTAHILIYLLNRDGEVTPESYKAFSKDKIVRHMCAKGTNHICNNPEHLTELPNTKEGRRQNSLDAVSYSKSTKLQEEEVIEIRELFEVLGIETNWEILERYNHLASIFGVGTTTIQEIIKRKTWANVAA